MGLENKITFLSGKTFFAELLACFCKKNKIIVNQ